MDEMLFYGGYTKTLYIVAGQSVSRAADGTPVITSRAVKHAVENGSLIPVTGGPDEQDDPFVASQVKQYRERKKKDTAGN